VRQGVRYATLLPASAAPGAGSPAKIIPHISRVRAVTASRSRAMHYESVPVRCSRVQSPRFLQVQRVLLAAIVGY
jgi:hypothetical protein